MILGFAMCVQTHTEPPTTPIDPSLNGPQFALNYNFIEAYFKLLLP